jgi:hypothetical protein
LRLRLAEPQPVQQHWNPGKSRRAPSARFVLPVILLLLALFAGGAYLARPQLLDFLSARSTSGPGGVSPTEASSPAVTPTVVVYEVSAPFVSFWNANKQVLGAPISPLRTETNGEGKSQSVQYFERARLELHPKADGTELEVLVGRLGAEVRVVGTVANPLPDGLKGEQVTFKETGISTPQKFNAFWQANGGALILGFPITPVLYAHMPDGSKLAVQYFERARFEYHPGEANEVQLTDLGRQIYQSRYGGR